MSVPALNEALDQLERLSRSLRFSEHLRGNVSQSQELLNQLEGARCAFDYGEISDFEDTYSRRADHVLTYVTAYAVLEQFVAERMRSVLRLYERSIAYQDLSQRTKKALRNGTLRLLSRLDWQRFQHLDELQIVKQYYEAISQADLHLVDEALLAHDANLRAEELREVLGNCGLAEAWSGVLNDSALAEFFANTILQDNTLESILNFAVQRRNDAVHSVGNEIDSTDVLSDVVSFFRLLILALFESTSREVVRFLFGHARLVKSGDISERFRKVIGIVELEPMIVLTVGDPVVVEYEGSPKGCFVQELQFDGTETAYVRGSKHLEIGVNFGRAISKVSPLYMFTDAQDAELVCI